MTGPERIYQFLKSHRREGYCDDCLENLTGVDRQEIQTITETIILFPNEFTRKRGVCPQRCTNRDKVFTLSI